MGFEPTVRFNPYNDLANRLARVGVVEEDAAVN
jgi:hypothetical protein